MGEWEEDEERIAALERSWKCGECGDEIKDKVIKDCQECGEGMGEEELEKSLLGLDVA